MFISYLTMLKTLRSLLPLSVGPPFLLMAKLLSLLLLLLFTLKSVLFLFSLALPARVRKLWENGNHLMICLSFFYSKIHHKVAIKSKYSYLRISKVCMVLLLSENPHNNCAKANSFSYFLKI